MRVTFELSNAREVRAMIRFLHAWREEEVASAVEVPPLPLEQVLAEVKTPVALMDTVTATTNAIAAASAVAAGDRVREFLQRNAEERAQVHAKEEAAARATETPPPSSPTVSETDAIVALQALLRRKGGDAKAIASAILSDFGVARVTELPAEQRAAFVARVQAA